jgi:hypothetical protein
VVVRGCSGGSGSGSGTVLVLVLVVVVVVVCSVSGSCSGSGTSGNGSSGSGSCFFDIDIFDWLTNNPDFDETNTKRGSCCFLALPCVVFVLFCLVLLCFVFLSCFFFG